MPSHNVHTPWTGKKTVFYSHYIWEDYLLWHHILIDMPFQKLSYRNHPLTHLHFSVKHLVPDMPGPPAHKLYESKDVVWFMAASTAPKSFGYNRYLWNIYWMKNVTSHNKRNAKLGLSKYSIYFKTTTENVARFYFTLTVCSKQQSLNSLTIGFLLLKFLSLIKLINKTLNQLKII